MDGTDEGKRKRSGVRASILRIVLPYSVVGAAWILFSDRALTLFESRPALLLAVSTAKGWLYVLITTVLLYILVSREFVRRAALERRLEADNREKAVLLAEIHHRVKNNLQVVSSILSLEEDQAEGAEAKSMCRTTAERVRAIALVHEQLYVERDFSQVDLAEYLRNLAAGLADIYGQGEGALVFDLDTVTVTPELAMPFGLLASEAITNALSHGRPTTGSPDGTNAERTVGPAAIALKRLPGGLCEFTVRDHGPGLASPRGRGLGLELMRGLASQLEAKLTIRDESGCVVTLRFNAREASPS